MLGMFSISIMIMVLSLAILVLSIIMKEERISVRVARISMLIYGMAGVSCFLSGTLLALLRLV